ncbi:hypothetical protein B1J94_13255 [Leptospira kirschneri serovar Grippotyphosa]|nr:hypothetical protein B1J94_13255 [Leptospira kirschneri serovar Grippotyphosa]
MLKNSIVKIVKLLQLSIQSNTNRSRINFSTTLIKYSSSSYIFVKLNASLLWSLCRSHLTICELSSSSNVVQFL